MKSLKLGKVTVMVAQVADIEVFPDYTAPPNAKFMERLRAAWKRDLAEVLICVYQDKKLVCINGRKRLTIMRERGDEHCLVCVLNKRDTAEAIAEAQFAGNVERRSPTPIETFRLGLAADRASHREVAESLRVHHFHVRSRDNDPVRDNTFHIRGVASLLKLWELGGLRLVSATLRVIQQCYLANTLTHELAELADHAAFVYALGDFLHARKSSLAAIMAKLKAAPQSPKAIIQNALTLAAINGDTSGAGATIRRIKEVLGLLTV